VALSDLGWAGRTRVCCLYDLTPRLGLRPIRELVNAYDFGRFEGHLNASARLLPRIAHTATLDGAQVGLRLDGDDPSGLIDELTLHVLVSSRHDAVLLLDVTMPEHASVHDVVLLLAATCFERHAMTVDDEPITGWLADELGLTEQPRFGRNVHQCVFPGWRLRDEIMGEGDVALTPAVTDIVYRGTVAADRGAKLGTRVPEALVTPGESLVAHGRGVSLIAGWARPVQNILTLTAANIVSALGVLHRSRDLAFDALTLSQDSPPQSTDEARSLVARLSNSLNELQLDLSFGVEACTDGVLVPEMVVDSYRESLRQATGLPDALANTSRMVERLSAVISAREAILEAAVQDEQNRKSNIFNVVLAIGSLIALPPSLLLAFFGVSSPDVDPSRSITDLGRYWGAYALAWLPFAALLLVGFILRRRIRETPRLLATADGASTTLGVITQLPPHQAPSTREQVRDDTPHMTGVGNP